jgi:hypothetical protein
MKSWRLMQIRGNEFPDGVSLTTDRHALRIGVEFGRHD